VGALVAVEFMSHCVSTDSCRLRRARAIVASVESEAHCSDVFMAMTARGGPPPGDAAATQREVAAAWRHATAQVSAATAGSQLLTRVFDIPYAHVVRNAVTASLPLFFGSREYSVYCNVVNMLRRDVFASSPLGATPAQLTEELLQQASSQPLTLSDFDLMGCVGAGSYGSVHVWRHKITGSEALCCNASCVVIIAFD
jgi:hypothetical protein